MAQDKSIEGLSPLQLFENLWTKAVEGPHYDPVDWVALQMFVTMSPGYDDKKWFAKVKQSVETKKLSNRRILDMGREFFEQRLHDHWFIRQIGLEQPGEFPVHVGKSKSKKPKLQKSVCPVRGAAEQRVDSKCPKCGGYYVDAALAYAQALHDENEACDGILAPVTSESVEPGLRKGVCRVCGCTESTPCPEGCAWMDESKTLCTACDKGTPNAQA